MNWKLTEPVFGDMIRVKVGNIYHYGIFVSQDEVVQFGLPPQIRPEIRDVDVRVCASDIDVFLAGGFVEVGFPDKSEKKKRRSAKETVLAARSRIGEGGYQIIHNNCEHFAYECYFGQKYSSQTDEVRKKFAALSEVFVYVAEIPEDLKIAKIYPKQRDGEISACKNLKVQREKYAVWKLLLHALKATYGYEAEALRFTKSPSGKWKCDECEFSLSHSNKIVAVAVSKSPIGIDVEEVKPPMTEKAAERVFSDDEMAQYLAEPQESKALCFAGLWTKKESIFKMLDLPDFLLSQPKDYNQKTTFQKLEAGGGEYALSVAHGAMQRVKFCGFVSLK